MSRIKRNLEELMDKIEYDDLYGLLISEGWTDKDIDALYGIYRD